MDLPAYPITVFKTHVRVRIQYLGDKMQVIDDKGRIFGRINIIDLAVLIVVGILIIGGVMFVWPEFAPAETDTRYVTVDLGEQPDYIAERLEVGDVSEAEIIVDDPTIDPIGNLTITDVYYGPGNDSSIIFRAEVTGELVDIGGGQEQLQFAAQPVVAGQPLEIATAEYGVDGTVIDVSESGETLSVDTEHVIVRAGLSASEIAELDVGDTYDVAGQTVGTIEDRRVYPGLNSSTAVVGMELITFAGDRTPRWGADRIQAGSNVSFRGDGYEFDGHVIRRGTSDIDRQDTSVILRANVDERTAERIASGDTFDHGGETLATINEVAAFDTVVNETVDVWIAAEYGAHRDGDQVRFGDTRLRSGEYLPFESDDYEIHAEIIERGEDLSIGTEEIVLSANVSRQTAQELDVGDEHLVAGEPVGSIESVRVYPTNVNDVRRVIVGVETQVRLDGDTVRLGEDRVTAGTAVSIRTADTAVEGQVEAVGTTDEVGEVEPRTVTLRKSMVDPDRADQIQPGMSEVLAGHQHATIESVNRTPASVIVETDDGQLFERDHPRLEDLRIEAEVETRSADGEIRFHGERLTLGHEVVLDLGTIVIRAEVVHID